MGDWARWGAGILDALGWEMAIYYFGDEHGEPPQGGIMHVPRIDSTSRISAGYLGRVRARFDFVVE